MKSAQLRKIQAYTAAGIGKSDMPDVRTGRTVHVRTETVNPMLAAQSAMRAANDGARASMLSLQVSFASIVGLFCLKIGSLLSHAAAQAPALSLAR